MPAPITEAGARALYGGSDPGHAFDHILRVTRLAVHIAGAEGADQEVVRTAGLLHDIARLEPDHHLVGAQQARHLLAGQPAAFVEAVAHCIEAHRFSTPPEPATPEARCLADADKLDAIGAVGVARAFAYAGHHGTRLWAAPLAEIAAEVGPDPRDYRRRHGGSGDYTPGHEYLCKLAEIAGRLYTPTARALAAEREAFMQAFFERLDREALGEA